MPSRLVWILIAFAVALIIAGAVLAADVARVLGIVVLCIGAAVAVVARMGTLARRRAAR